MFKKRESKNKNVRRRERGDDEDEDDAGVADASAAQKSKASRKPSEGVLGFSSVPSKKAKSEEDEAATTRFAYNSNREVQVTNDNKATAALETETEHDRDARALREKYLKRAEAALKGNKGDDEDRAEAGQGKPKEKDDKVYKGVHGYIDHKAGFRQEHTVSGEKASGAHGPLRASTNVRMTVMFDYKPDLCKDYKETGYCGYGDACKFMHDRGDYKSGWQLEREWDEKEKKRKAMLAMGIKEEDEEEEGSEDEDALPFACFICREPFVDPVVTKCKHYFCEHCALKHNAKNKNCFVCNKATSGVFNTAHEILRRQKEIKEKAAKE